MNIRNYVLPYPPSLNRMYRAVNGRSILSAEGRAYKARVASILAAEGGKPFACPVHVNIDVFRPAKRGDLDNTLKALLDVLRGVAYCDDSQIVEIVARRFEDKENPRASVCVWPEVAA